MTVDGWGRREREDIDMDGLVKEKTVLQEERKIGDSGCKSSVLLDCHLRNDRKLGQRRAKRRGSEDSLRNDRKLGQRRAKGRGSEDSTFEKDGLSPAI